MKQWVKIVLVLGIVVVAAGIGISAIFYFWIQRTLTQTEVLAPAAQRAGREFGGHATQDGCISEGARRAALCTSIGCEVAEKGFLESCYGLATVDPKACAGVPKPDKILDSVAWGPAECARRGYAANQRCQRLMSDVQQLCAR